MEGLSLVLGFYYMKMKGLASIYSLVMANSVWKVTSEGVSVVAEGGS